MKHLKAVTVAKAHHHDDDLGVGLGIAGLGVGLVSFILGLVQAFTGYRKDNCDLCG